MSYLEKARQQLHSQIFAIQQQATPHLTECVLAAYAQECLNQGRESEAQVTLHYMQRRE